ncbi:MAG: HEAT repeat domain-containing protein [Pirellulales bacterium]|nr:HEAT repeat domain-containing protein [Pirellulales bacterium]
MLDQAFETLKTYDWGTDRNLLNPIDEAIVASQADPAARRGLEGRLVAVLKTDVTRAAKDFVCRALMILGTADSVPALAALLAEPEQSHMARYALERITAPEAAQAMRDALPKLDGQMKIGVIGSLGARRDVASVPALAALLGDTDTAIARSAALALGAIGTPAAAKALMRTKPTSAEAASAVTDAALDCAEGLLAAGKSVEALAVYKRFAGEDQPKHVRLAATRGMLACAGK